MSKTVVKLKRAYERPESDDGARVLVDRLWPRGVRKADAAIDQWLKELAPSTELRKWFGHDPARWTEFQSRYQAELKDHADLVGNLRALARRGPVTLVYAARDQVHNEAVVLRVESGRLVVVVPADTPSQQEFDAAQFLAIELTLEDGRTLTVGVQGDAVGADFSVDCPRRDGVRPLAATELSTVWAASA